MKSSRAGWVCVGTTINQLSGETQTHTPQTVCSFLAWPISLPTNLIQLAQTDLIPKQGPCMSGGFNSTAVFNDIIVECNKRSIFVELRAADEGILLIHV